MGNSVVLHGSSRGKPMKEVSNGSTDLLQSMKQSIVGRVPVLGSWDFGNPGGRAAGHGPFFAEILGKSFFIKNMVNEGMVMD